MYRYLCAVVASSSAVSDPAGARKLGIASIVMSVVGIVLSVIVVIILASVLSNTSYCNYRVNGSCYRYRSSYYVSCEGVPYLGYCYYN